ncbi:hypothetical protein [Marinobacter sp. F4216]|uniref:hypothetical protein n=1 Tax=Marinobacter sp. F4216 TaxID=2874281 RepID=UPI001CBD2672|nr:hypothetical protein [Marinobacter sp. F4216]MBZ2168422.1 hypothetical protein [Marinobacter sp. F4216]
MRDYKRWVGGLVIGAIIGASIGLIQVNLIEKKRYVAALDLKERIFFNEFWEAAPDVLLKAELMRSSYSQEKASGLDPIVADLLNGWFRLLDDTLFKFPIDEALKSTAISASGQRYVEINPGFIDGLGQRSITFRIVGNSPESVNSELLQWVADVKHRGNELSLKALRSWLSRKAYSLEAMSNLDGREYSKLQRIDLHRMAEDFERAAQSLPSFDSFLNEPPQVQVAPVPVSLSLRVLIWGALGMGLAFLVLTVFQAKRAR